MAAVSGRTATLTDGGEPERVSAQLVTANLFPTLGTSPQRGRSFEDRDDQPSAAGVALIGDALWRRRYQAEPAATAGVRLDNVPTRSSA